MVFAIENGDMIKIKLLPTVFNKVRRCILSIIKRKRRIFRFENIRRHRVRKPILPTTRLFSCELNDLCESRS